MKSNYEYKIKNVQNELFELMNTFPQDDIVLNKIIVLNRTLSKYIIEQLIIDSNSISTSSSSSSSSSNRRRNNITKRM
jgi:hypothetical protein